MSSLNELAAEIQRFNDARDWQEYHTPRSLVLAICSEAGELAHLVRWVGLPEVESGEWLKDNYAHREIADIMIFCLSLCNVLGFDPEQAIRDKMLMNSDKYPAT